MLFLPINSQTNESVFANSTLLLSVPTVGNVGQLAADLLICSFPFEMIGYLDTKGLVAAMAGNDAYTKKSNGTLCTAVEVYRLQGDNSIILIHVRAPILSRKFFSTQFVQYVKTLHISQLVLLSSANATFRADRHIIEQKGKQDIVVHALITPNNTSKLIPEIKIIEQPFENANENAMQLDNEQNESPTESGDLIRHLNKELWMEICNANAFPAVMLFVFCFEGDNKKQGIALTRKLILNKDLFPYQQPTEEITSMENYKLKQPPSWNFLLGTQVSIKEHSFY